MVFANCFLKIYVIYNFFDIVTKIWYFAAAIGDERPMVNH